MHQHHIGTLCTAHSVSLTLSLTTSAPHGLLTKELTVGSTAYPRSDLSERSWDAEASSPSSGENATQYTLSLWP